MLFGQSKVENVQRAEENQVDVYSPENFKNDACAHPLTREQYRILINMGFTDLVKHFVEGKTNWTATIKYLRGSLPT